MGHTNSKIRDLGGVIIVLFEGTWQSKLKSRDDIAYLRSSQQYVSSGLVSKLMAIRLGERSS